MSDANFDSGFDEQNRSDDGRGAPSMYGDGGSNIDRFFDALADTRRRHVLIHLQSRESAFLQAVARYVAKQEGVSTQDEEFERIQIDLLHLHLPKLADHGLISFDSRTNTARREPLPDPVEEILELTADLEESGTSNS